MKVYNVTAEISAILQSKKTVRKCSAVVGAEAPEQITIDICNLPENLSRFIPRFIAGRLRNHYKVTKVLEIGPALGLEGAV